MVDASVFTFAIPAMVAIILVPGPDMLFVLSKSASGGVRSGLVAVAGIISGGVVHVGSAAIGLSALILRSAVLFSVVKYAGAAYLIYLGILVLAKRPGGAGNGPSPQRPGSTFVQGLSTNVLNPKAMLFVLAFFPQFVDQSRGHVTQQIVELGAVWYALGALILSLVALAGSAIERLRRRSRAAARLGDIATGGIFIALGLRVLLTVQA